MSRENMESRGGGERPDFSLAGYERALPHESRPSCIYLSSREARVLEGNKKVIFLITEINPCQGQR